LLSGDERSADLPAGELTAQGRDLGDGEADVGLAGGDELVLELAHVDGVVAEPGFDCIEALGRGCPRSRITVKVRPKKS
jgi:hypothetical protein